MAKRYITRKNILSGQRFLLGIHAEIEKDPNVKHAIIIDLDTIPPLEDITAKQNVCFLKDFQNIIHKNMPFPRIDREALETTFQETDVIWIIGALERPLPLIWRWVQILFGNHDIPLAYETTRSNRYTDERGQSVYEQEAVSVLVEAIESVNLNHTTGKKLTGLQLPNITDRTETLLFDSEDFLVAGGLDKLALFFHLVLEMDVCL